jgi:hypothetical protein
MQAKKLIVALSALGILVGLTGCPDTEGEFNNFIERYESNKGEATSSTGSGGASACQAPMMAGDMDGDYQFTLSAALSPKKPILFAATIATSDGPNGLQFTLGLQPLDAADRATKVGTAIEVGPFDVAADGSFSAKLPPLDVIGSANAISGSDLAAEVTLDGNLCGDFSCGSVSGEVTKPAIIDLVGSTFTIDKLDAAGMYNEPVLINCAKDEAASL